MDTNITTYYEVLTTSDKLQYTYNLFIKNVFNRMDDDWTHLLKKTLDLCHFLKYPNEDPYFKGSFNAIIANKDNQFFSNCPITPVSFEYTWYILKIYIHN